jgi:hypothetical protein
MSSGSLPGVGSEYIDSVPDVVILPTLPDPDVNHRSLAHGLGAIEVPGALVFHMPTLPVAGLISPTPDADVNHMFPSGPATMSVACAGIVYMVTDPDVVIRPSSSQCAGASTVYHRFPSGPAAMAPGWTGRPSGPQSPAANCVMVPEVVTPVTSPGLGCLKQHRPGAVPPLVTVNEQSIHCQASPAVLAGELPGSALLGQLDAS